MKSESESVHLLSRAFDEVFDGLFGYAMILSQDRTEAEDLVQETCVRAIRAIASLHPGGNIKSWLFTILRNIWLNQLRKRRTAPNFFNLDVSENSSERAVETRRDPHPLYVSEIERKQVQAAIQLLPRGYREIIVLREYGEMSYHEIASVLGCPVGTVMSRLARARSKLRTLLSADLPGPDEQQKGAEE
jgi:RNA polymerase sigma-70 factor, ECF subfamily